MRTLPIFAACAALLVGSACDDAGSTAAGADTSTEWGGSGADVDSGDATPDTTDTGGSGDTGASGDTGDGDASDTGTAPDADDPCAFGACSWAIPCEGSGCPTVSELRAVVPGDGLPAELQLQAANNNLDIARFDGRLFLAFRTAPNHFASALATLNIVSTDDEQTWRYEGSFALGTDLREPRLLSWHGRLWLYFAVLGSDPAAFQPGEMRVSEYLGDGTWTESAPFYGPGFIPWRVRVVDDVPYMFTYKGGENIYETDGEPVEVHFLTTTDGVTWTAAGAQPDVLLGGGSETDGARLDDGSWVFVSRNEAGGDYGFGSLVCTAPADAIADWSCRNDDRRKYDSPLVFRQGSDVYLVGRRNLTENGYYDLENYDLPLQQQKLRNEWDYWNHPKRCSLWKVDPATREVSFVLDLPSRGDTCFASVDRIDDHRLALYNYSSLVTGADWVWNQGQTHPTFIYRMVLTFP